MREIYIKSNVGLLDIGRRGENLVTRVHLPEVPESGQYVTVFIKRNGDTVAYPASQVEVTDAEIIWTVTSVDTGKSGRGKVQYKFSDATTGEVIKTEIYGFLVGLAIDTEVGPAPDPYETWLDSLTDLAGQAQVAARDAEDYAESASESAEQAEASATAASASATTATGRAAEAALSATQARNSAISTANSERGTVAKAAEAAQSAESAGASATSAETSATSAYTSAESASWSKTAAEAARQSAYEWAMSSRDYSEAARQSATAASQSETSADESATAAEASATSASQSSATATTKASEASASATTATAKAAEASASSTAAQEARTGAETAQAGAESAAETAQAGADAVGLLREQIYNSYPNVEAEAGPIVSISDGADGIPVKSLVVGIEPVQEGSGDPSPDNVRPITGWTGCEIVRTGVGLFDKDAITENIWINLDSTEIRVANGYATTDYIPVKQGHTIYIPYKGSARNAYYDTNKNGIAYFAFSGGAFTPQYTGFIRCTYVMSAVDLNTYQINLGSTATSYEPYQGTTYPITFPTEAGTVYGGTLDVTNGVLTVDRAMVDMGSLRWTYNTTYAFFTTNASALQGRKIGVLNLISDLFKTEAGSWSGTPKTNAIWGNGSNATVYVQYPITEVSEFLSLVSGHQLVYELATPITYQLTPTEVKTLLGQNNVWADTGDVQEMAYRADPKLYIDGVYEEYQDDLADYADALAALG